MKSKFSKSNKGINFFRLLVTVVMIVTVLGPVGALKATPVAAQTNLLQLSVISANDSPTYSIIKGDPITNFKYIINSDNSGTTDQRSPDPGSGCSTGDAGYPDTCNWVSIAGVASSSPIVTQGDQSDFGAGITLPDGRYLISVLADGFKIDGAHFTMPLADPGIVTVQMQPYDLPDATIQAEVFEDVAPTNSAPDVPAERGLAGFEGHIADYIDEVTTDIYGDPLCGGGSCVSQCYAVDGGVDLGIVSPIDSDGRCPFREELPADATTIDTGVAIPAGAVIEGKLIIPHLGPNRYALSIVRPDGTDWAQTTTLEGNHDWDSWVMEGATGLDTEFVVAGEPFPATFFGFVKPMNTMGAGSSTIIGKALAVSAYIPPVGGIGGEAGLLGAKPKDVNPIHRLFVSLSDINNNDQTVFMQEYDCAEAAGCPPVDFSIPNVPAGDYVLGVWDEPQDYIFLEQNVSVQNGEIVDLGSLSMLGWWTTIEGHVFNDLNENGKMDAGEPGIPNFPIVMRTRENSIMDRGATLVTTDANGYYWMENAYPITQWLVEEAYADGFQTTGVTYQADNQPEETTVLGQGVDINVHPVIGLGGRLDWGVKAYAPGTNGGIVGTISYDTTRNELDPSYAAIEDWQPSISGLKVDLFAPITCPNDGVTPCDKMNLYALNADGSYALGPMLNQYVSEIWQRPTGCIARNVDGNPLVHGVDENVLPLDPNAGCIEAPMMGVQFGTMSDGTNFGASVDGNYGFGDGCFLDDGITPGAFDPGTGSCSAGAFLSLPSNRDYLVKVEIPTEKDVYPDTAVHPDAALYQVTREEDINIANGDSFVPAVPPPQCAGPLHTVDVEGSGTDSYGQVVGTGYGATGNGVAIGVTVQASTPVHNPTFVDIGGTIYEGQAKPLCDMKLVRLSDRKSVAPGFNLFTDVPLPGRFWGLIVDDLNFSSNPKSIAYGEKLPLSFAPVGVYDYTNRLIYTVESDYNGLFDVLLPSTNRISCPTPSGVCANLYRFVGNDPGTPGKWNANYNPQYRTISAEFEAFPGLTLPADLAPTPVAVAVQIPGLQTTQPAVCTLNDPNALLGTPNDAGITPDLFAVDKPYVLSSGSFTINGQGFGTTQGTGSVTLDGIALPITSWSASQIGVTVPSGSVPGAHQLKITSANGKSTINGLTFHVISGGTIPRTAVIDQFNRANGGLGITWGGDGNTQGIFRIQSQRVQVRGTGNTWRQSSPTTPVLYGANQDAYFTFNKISTTGTEQGLLLKSYGVPNWSAPNGNSAYWIEVAYNGTNAVIVRTKVPGQNAGSATLRASFPATFTAGDRLEAIASADGTVDVYRNTTQIGSVNVTTTGPWPYWPLSYAQGGGAIGVRFVGPTSQNDAQFDNFGGGNALRIYSPTVIEVGPTGPHAIQDALDLAASASGQDYLIVVYPGAVDASNPRYNGRGAYYENLIMYSPVKLQGVGPGGVRADGTIVQGTILDGIAFGGDTTLATDWLTKITSLSWDGSQDINDGQVIYVLASQNQTGGSNQARQFGSIFKASIDGFEIRGGDQQGLPGNLNAIFGGFPGPITPLQVVTQGGAIFANAYARNLQITNNLIDSNGGSYGTIRIGTPNLIGPDTDQHNENVRIANNRILANGGTNLAGAIGLFNGSDGYEIAGNDLCGNFSAEYGGAISHFGFSPASKIHDNRIYYNHSYDEGAGIIIAGELATDPGASYGQPGGPQGSGSVDIYNNLIQANMAEDDGGGLRFLMAGNFTMNVYNNMIVNNISMHEGGGVALDDAPGVRFYSNTVMNNKTTATAITSDGQPAPAGLSTGANSDQLQSTLPAGAPLFSNPVLFDNVFWDNWAGTKGVNTVTGITSADSDPWDMGVVGAPFLLSPTYSVLQPSIHPGTNSSPTNLLTNPLVVTQIDIPLSFTSWRTNINFIGAIMVTADLPPFLTGNYHLSGSGSPAYNRGAASQSGVNAPFFDIDYQNRPLPAGGAFDIGADEVP